MHTLNRAWRWGIWLVLFAVQLQAQGLTEAQKNRLHPAFQQLLQMQSAQPVLAKAAVPSDITTITSETGERLFAAIVFTERGAELKQSGLRINTVTGRFVTAHLSLEELADLAADERIQYIEPGSKNYPALDVSVPQTGAHLLHAGFLNNTAYKGKGVIIAIYDTGIDWKHFDFRDPNDTTKTRIIAIWDQTLTREAGEKYPAGFSYGVEYTRADIENELDGSPEGFVRTKDSNGHGTHVASIAAGNGQSLEKKYIGMAPEAELLIIKGGDNSFSEPHIIDGLTYAENVASQLGKPLVVNWSLGSQEGPHDGTRAYEKLADDFLKKPGRALIIAAGNDGGRPIHIAGQVQPGQVYAIDITVPQYTPKQGKGNDDFILDIWFEGDQSITAEVTSPSGVVVTAAPGKTAIGDLTTDGRIELRNQQSTLNGKRNINLKVSDAGTRAQEPREGTWTLILRQAAGTMNFDGWLADYTIGEDRKRVTINNGDTDKTVAMPGTAIQPITVASFVSKWSWPASNGKNYIYSNSTNRTGDISTFSGIGPTRDGRMKPEIAAPGQGIAAALSSDATPSESRIQPGERHQVIQGTSMAAPHVAGAAALLLSAFPNAAWSQLKGWLLDSAVRDDYTGNTVNPVWGHGKMDVYRAMLQAQNGSATQFRELLAYDEKGSNSIVTLTGNVKYAVRITPSISGTLTGLWISTTTQANRPIVGQGPLLCEVYTNVAGSNYGVPGQKIGQTVQMAFAQLSSGIFNFVNMLPAGVNVTAGTDYHVVLSVANPGDTLIIRTDASPAEAQRSSIYTGSAWHNFGAAGSGLPALNLRIQAEVTGAGQPTSVASGSVLPQKLALFQNYPNPFNPETQIRFDLPTGGPVQLRIYDMLGRVVRTLVNQRLQAGVHVMRWDGRDQNGRPVASGIYFYELITPSQTLSRKMILMQ